MKHIFVKFKDFDEIINKLSPKTNFSFDSISSKLLKSITSAVVNPITIIINQMINTGIFSDMLKIAKVIPFYKKMMKCN